MKHSELRQDIVSDDWILIAPGRLHNLNAFLEKKSKRKASPMRSCPFENRKPLENISENIILQIPAGKTAWKEKYSDNWKILVLQNKYPAVIHSERDTVVSKIGGFFNVAPGVGHHDLIITRGHYADFSCLSSNDAYHVFESFRDRYLMLLTDKNIEYISIFHNWGRSAGASVFHPHYQILAIPIVPPDIHHSLNGSERYMKTNGECVHCAMIKWERRQKKRIILETDEAIAFTPFVSRNPFEVRVFPKKHSPYFENTLDDELYEIAMVLKKTLFKIRKNLNDPDYNFFIHTSPMKDKKKYSFYHWHIEIYPIMTVRAGFEYDTGMWINVVDPDLAAKVIRK